VRLRCASASTSRREPPASTRKGVLFTKVIGGGSNGAAPADIAIDSNGDAVLVGPFFGTIDFGAGATDFGMGPLKPVGASDIVVAKFAP
jgi:hypothetical protein